MSNEDISFTKKLYGQGQFQFSIDDIALPDGFVKYHKANFAQYLGMPESGFAGLSILDTGAGPCKHAIVLALMGADVMATDLTPANLEKGVSLRAHYKLNNINFRQHDMMWPVDFGGPYDVVTAHNWMQHAENPAKVFMNLVSAVKPGGRIYLSLYHGGTFRFFIAQIARSLLSKRHYETMRELVRYAFPTGFKEFNNPVDIYMENIFDDFFVPYCHTTTYDVVLHDAKLLGLEPVGEVPVDKDLAGLDNIPLRIGLMKTAELSPELDQLHYVKPVDEFASLNPMLLRSAELAQEVIKKLKSKDDLGASCDFCFGLYRLRAQLNAVTELGVKHGALQFYLESCLDDDLRNISYFHDAAKLHKS